jgi:hypothetical protein
MKLSIVIAFVGFGLALLVTPGAALAAPPTCSACGIVHQAPAPLLAAGIPAFALLGGGTAVRWVRKVSRRN